MCTSLKKLKIHQKYHIHDISVLLFTCVTIIFLMWIVDWIEQKRLVQEAKHWLDAGKLSSEQYNACVELISSSPLAGAHNSIFIIFVVFFISYYCIQWFYSQFMLASTSLSEATEFTEVFKEIGCMQPKERIDFIVSNKTPVYMAQKPLLNRNDQNIMAKLLPYHVYRLLPHSLIPRLIGERKLCMAKEDYDEIVKKHKALFEKSINAEILNYKTLLAESTSQQETLRVENLRLKEDIDTLKQNVKENSRDNSAAIEGKQASSDASRFDFFRIAIPVIDKMTQTFTGQKYTRSDIQVFFFKELDSQPEYKEAVFASAVDKNGNLRPWATEALRKKLGDMAETEGGRPRKSNKADSG